MHDSGTGDHKGRPYNARRLIHSPQADTLTPPGSNAARCAAARAIIVLITIFLLGFLEISLPLPIVIVMDGPIEPAFAVIGVSGSLGTLFFVYLSQPIRRWVVRRWGMDSVVFTRTERFMVQYGAAGVGLLAPMILGHALTAVGAVVLGAPTRKLAFWMIAGVWLWTVFYYAVILAGGTWIAGID